MNEHIWRKEAGYPVFAKTIERISGEHMIYQQGALEIHKRRGGPSALPWAVPRWTTLIKVLPFDSHYACYWSRRCVWRCWKGDCRETSQRAQLSGYRFFSQCEATLWSSRQELLLISRLDKKPSSSHPLQNVQSVQLDYSNVPSMAKTLEELNVHSIISSIVLVSEDASQSQQNLIDAAGASAVTKRFIPSEFLFIQPSS